MATGTQSNKPTLKDESKKNSDDTPDVTPDTLPDEPDVNETALEEEKKRDKTLAEKLDSGEFDETDADDDPNQGGWIVMRTNDNGTVKEHRVPVQHWNRYSRIHNL